MVSGELIRAGRALLGWSAKELAGYAHVGIATVLRMERNKSSIHGQRATAEKIEKALEQGGIRFIGNERDASGVQLIKPHGQHD